MLFQACVSQYCALRACMHAGSEPSDLFNVCIVLTTNLMPVGSNTDSCTQADMAPILPSYLSPSPGSCFLRLLAHNTLVWPFLLCIPFWGAGHYQLPAAMACQLGSGSFKHFRAEHAVVVCFDGTDREAGCIRKQLPAEQAVAALRRG